MQTTPPIVVAAVRGLIGAVAIAGGAYFAALQGGADPHVALYAAAGAFCLAIGARVGVEGLLDQSRAK